MRLSTAVALALTALLAAFTVGAVAAPAAAASPAADGSLASPSSQPQPTVAAADAATQNDADGDEYEPEPADPWQVIRLNVTDDGDVRWTLESRFLVPENETDEFEAYADAVATGDRSGGYDVERYERFRADAERSTGREMALENATWEEPRIESLDGEDGNEDAASGDRKLGTISYSFTWTNFAVVDEQRIRFGDAFVTEHGVALPILEDGQRLVIESPPNYGVETAPAGIQDGTVRYDGYATLDASDFQIVFLRSSGGEPPGGTNGTTPEPRGGSGVLSSPERVGAAFGGFVLLIVLTSLVISRYQRSAWPFDESATDEPSVAGDYPRSAETDGSGATAADPAAHSGSESGVEHEFDEAEAVSGADSTATGTAGAGTGSAVETDSDSEEIDVELLSDEERVRRMLEGNGGRMKQATIVKETGWSDAKVSQLLSEMDDDDQIQKLRIGRENLITLPDVDPTETE